MPQFILIGLDDGTPTSEERIREVLVTCNLIARLNRNGKIVITKSGYIEIKEEDQKEITYVDLAIRLAQFIGADPNDPRCQGHICTCPTSCDCANPPPDNWDGKNGVFNISNECPIHNATPQPSSECPQHGENWVG